jgi:hypothetical protein
MTEIDASRLIAGARALMLAGQWTLAADLLAAARADGDGERAVLAVAEAEVAVDHDFWCRTGGGALAVNAAAPAVAAAGEAVPAFDLDFARLRTDYLDALFDASGEWIEPGRRDPASVAALVSRAEALRAAAPDGGRAGFATFYAGVVHENIAGDAATAASRYAQALENGDELTQSYALRHLGYQAAEAGDDALAAQQMQRSADLRMRAGCVPLVLAQQVAIAGNLRDRGDPEAARGLATAVLSWATALRLPMVIAEAAPLADAR